MVGDAPRIEYVEARRVLLDVLGALSDHLNAVVLVGAQAVCLRTAGRIESYQPFTTDADIVVDTTLLGLIPPLGRSMEAADSFSPTNREYGKHDSCDPASTSKLLFLST